VDNDINVLTKLKQEMRPRQQHLAAGPRLGNESVTPQIKMFIGNWYTDELGNQSRIIKACD
jgi:hypothetical protein